MSNPTTDDIRAYLMNAFPGEIADVAVIVGRTNIVRATIYLESHIQFPIELEYRNALAAFLPIHLRYVVSVERLEAP